MSITINKWFQETNDPQDVHNNSYGVEGERGAIFLKLPESTLENINQLFQSLNEKLDPEHRDNFRLCVSFRGDQPTDLLPIYETEEKIRPDITYDDLLPLITAFNNVTKQCVGHDHDILLFGKNVTADEGLTDSEGWHCDGEDEVAGILALGEDVETTRFRISCADASTPKDGAPLLKRKNYVDISAPQNCVAFVGDKEHCTPVNNRPTLHVIDYGNN